MRIRSTLGRGTIVLLRLPAAGRQTRKGYVEEVAA
jgi:hypothetical protein